MPNSRWDWRTSWSWRSLLSACGWKEGPGVAVGGGSAGREGGRDPDLGDLNWTSSKMAGPWGKPAEPDGVGMGGMASMERAQGLDCIGCLCPYFPFLPTLYSPITSAISIVYSPLPQLYPMPDCHLSLSRVQSRAHPRVTSAADIFIQELVYH